MPAPAIRPARPDDVAAIARLIDDAYGHYVARMGQKPGPMQDDYQARVAEGTTWVIADGRPLQRRPGSARRTRPSDVCVEPDLFIAPPCGFRLLRTPSDAADATA